MCKPAAYIRSSASFFVNSISSGSSSSLVWIMEVCWSLRALLISSLCLWGTLQMTEGCDTKDFTLFAYYNHEGNWERCKVRVTGCMGRCYNSYEHFAHKESDNYDSPEENCKWKYRNCIETVTDTSATSLFGCSPVSGGTSAFDNWTVVVKHATACTCSSLTSGEGTSGINFV